MWNLEKQIQMNLFTKQTQCLQKTILCLPKGKQGVKGRIYQEIGINIHTLLYVKQIINKNLLYSTDNSTKYSVEWVYRYVYMYN